MAVFFYEQDSNSRFCKAKVAKFGVVNEAKESAEHFLERMNGGGFSRYPVPNCHVILMA